MVVYWNSQEFIISPDANIKARHSGFTTVDPQDGQYDYRFEVKCDLNRLLSPLKFVLDANSSTVETVSGSREAWISLHSLLQEGCSPQSEAKTYYEDRCSLEDNTWKTFWYGLLSQSLDPQDRAGNSVRVDVVRSILEDASDAKNPLLGALFSSFASDYDHESSHLLDAHSCYFGALSTFVFDIRGGAALAQGLKFNDGDSIGIRIIVWGSTGCPPCTGLVLVGQSNI